MRTSSIRNRSSSKIAAEAAAPPKAKPLFEKVRKRGVGLVMVYINYY